MISDEELILNSVRGDVRAFEQLVLKYQNKVYSLAFRFMGNEQDAYDMAQEAMVKMHRYLPQFKGDSAFGTWLYRITYNVCLDELRRRKRRIIPLSLDESVATGDGAEYQKDVADNSLNPEVVLENQALSEQIQHVLNQMSSEHRAVIVLRDILHCSYEEMASILGCSLGTVKSRLNRGRSILKQRLVKEELIL